MLPSGYEIAILVFILLLGIGLVSAARLRVRRRTRGEVAPPLDPAPDRLER